MTILVTGSAGFIGFHVTKRLLELGQAVIGIDNLNSYYDTSLKLARLQQLRSLALNVKSRFAFIKADIADSSAMEELFLTYRPRKVINLAAQAGVRYSIENPFAYIESNLVGFSYLLEACRHHEVEQFLYASSSSVYGSNTKIPCSEKDNVDHPVSLYAASKRANELLAHSYSSLYNLPTIGMRFFTVYGPWGRPDMALFIFTRAILDGRPIQVFNNGNMIRDFTYIDDITEAVIRLLDKPACADPDFNRSNSDLSTSSAPYRIFNIGNSHPIPLMTYIETLEMALGLEAKKEFLPMQLGDVQITSADTSALAGWTGFKPNTSVKDGVFSFVAWFKKYYGV